MSISEPCIESATVTCLLPEVLCIYTTSVHTVAILYTQGVRLQTVGLSARCMFLDGPGAKNDFYIFFLMVKKRKKSEDCPGGPVVKNPPCGHSPVVRWLRPCTPNTRHLGSIPGQEARSHVPQLRPYAAK